MENEEKIENCSICKNDFNVYNRDNSGYVGKNGQPVCAGCCEDNSI